MGIEILEQLFFSRRAVTRENNYEEAIHHRDKTEKKAQKDDCRLFKGKLAPVYAAPLMSRSKQVRTVLHWGNHSEESHESPNKI
jgi:hypothetical protein